MKEIPQLSPFIHSECSHSHCSCHRANVLLPFSELKMENAKAWSCPKRSICTWLRSHHEKVKGGIGSLIRPLTKGQSFQTQLICLFANSSYQYSFYSHLPLEKTPRSGARSIPPLTKCLHTKGSSPSEEKCIVHQPWLQLHAKAVWPHWYKPIPQ